ncbi:helix-turn-helix transcriptional regulator [Streptomyces sp. SPB074]|uniref:helix-turn-helix transcriptional regulator n=1 Tax=Streptomyces sp. (strain SPB074) TaxID=465543 RepID=UPI00017F27AC|nr:helix-turn-helix transcriptional regulator [Streptomyces sp. SPB074]
MPAIAQRVREARRRKDYTAQQLADQLRALGVAWDRATVTKLETGRRQGVSVVEWLALARALDVAPVHLLVPPSEIRYKPVPAAEYDADAVRAWVRGLAPLPGTNERIFYTETPADEWRDPGLPARAEAENEVSRYLVPGVGAARRAGLSLETVLAYIESQWKVSEALERGSGGEGV